MEERLNLNRLAYFVATVEAGSITAAAERLELSKAVISKHLQLLEQEVGVSLLARNTRQVQPTQAGDTFYRGSKALLIQAQQAFDDVRESSEIPTGRLRVAAPVDFGVAHVAPLVARFQARYPKVQVELELNDLTVDILKHRYDLTFRIGWLADSGNRARQLREFHEVVVCAPSFARKHNIRRPQDLIGLPFMASTALGGNIKCQFRRGKTTQPVALRAQMESNVTLAIREAVMTGSCFTILPDFMLAQDIADRRLTTLLSNWRLRKGGVYVMSPPSRLQTRAAQTFLEMTREQIG